LKKDRPPHWIEIELLGEDGQGIAYEEYLLTLPSGRQLGGMLDEHGYARVDSIEDSGECVITFPDLDTEAWQFTESLGPQAQEHA
jgi:hypothetical protein